jgi:segregation and condensation protein B
VLCHVVGADEDLVRGGLEALAGRSSGLEVAEVAGGWTLRTRPEHAAAVARLAGHAADPPLSPAAMETLAIAAYLAPISRPDIARLRGVAADTTVGRLVERGLLEEAGRGGGPGDPVLYRTTRRFERLFGLPSLEELPPIEEFELAADDVEALRERLTIAAAARDDG